MRCLCRRLLMSSGLEQRAALQLITASAVATAQELYSSTTGSPKERRLQMLDDVPAIIGYYAEGSAALAADFYEETRAAAGARASFSVDMTIADRVVKIRRGIAWAAEPLFDDFSKGDAGTPDRLAEIVQLESARPYRDTITSNRLRDPDAVGWQRIAAGGCKFCRMLADRGAVYKSTTANFASHPHCHCTAQPVFRGGDVGPEADPIQYMASRRSRTPAQRAEIRDYLNSNYPDDHG
jgi:hypothetical protein